MNYIKHLAGFFERVATDERLNASHISMYVSLFQFWNANRFQNPISIARSEVMRVSKISAKATYHKCLSDLHKYGYLSYAPSHNPIKGSKIYLFNFQTTRERAAGNSRTKNRTTREQPVGPFINSTNISKQENIVNRGKIAEELKMLQPLEASCPAETLEAQQTSCHAEALEKSKRRPNKNIPHSLEEVIEYFSSRGHVAEDAERYYNHFCSNGWLVGGKAPMKDWKAAARNWMLNTKNYNNESRQSLHPGNLHATTAKDYAEPL